MIRLILYNPQAALELVLKNKLEGHGLTFSTSPFKRWTLGPTIHASVFSIFHGMNSATYEDLFSKCIFSYALKGTLIKCAPVTSVFNPPPPHPALLLIVLFLLNLFYQRKEITEFCRGPAKECDGYAGLVKASQWTSQTTRPKFYPIGDRGTVA